MKYNEIITEMALTRKRIIRALENYDVRIFEHAVKCLVMPNSPHVQHWKNELLAWAGYLSDLRMRTDGNPPMGYKLAYEYLYAGPFVGNELGMTKHFIELAEASYQMTFDVAVEDVHQRLKVFLTKLSEAVGLGQRQNVKLLITSL